MNKNLEFIGDCFSDSETYHLLFNTLFPIMEEKFGRKIYKIMLYDSYHKYDSAKNIGTYRFKHNQEIYYPLTVFVGRKVEMVWVKWGERYLSKPQISPFMLKPDAQVSLCNEIPQEFEDFISDKKLYYIRNKNVVGGGILASGFYETDIPKIMGKYNRLFIDEASRQIQERLEELIGEKLTNRWSFGFSCVDGPQRWISPVIKNNVNYLSVMVLGPFGHAAYCGIAWDGEIKTSDCVKENDFTIKLIDVIPGTEHMTDHEKGINNVWCTKLETLKQFLLHGGWYFQE